MALTNYLYKLENIYFILHNQGIERIQYNMITIGYNDYYIIIDGELGVFKST